MSALAFEGVACLRGGRLLFEELRFSLQAGQAALVSGPNGAGKSSLIRIAAGLLAPTAGKVMRDGDMALLSEIAGLDPELPLADALRFWTGGDVAAALTDTGLADLGRVPVRFLSTGQRRRAALARVVASGAGIWLLDEPANGLDIASVVQLEGLIARHRSAGGIVLIATHLPLAIPDAVAVQL